MTPLHFFTPALEAVDSQMPRVVQKAYEALGAYAHGPLVLGLTLYIIFQGYSIIRGQTQSMSLAEFGWQAAKWGIIIELLLTWGSFNTVIYQSVWGVYNDMANGLSAALVDGTSSLSTLNPGDLDTAFSSQLNAAADMAFGAPDWGAKDVELTIPLGSIFGSPTFTFPLPYPDVSRNFMGLLMVITTIILFASVFVVLLLSRIGMVSCLAVSPIFIALMMFEQTRSYTDSWFRGLMGFALTPVLLMVVLLIADATRDIVVPPTILTGTVAGMFIQLVPFLLLQYALTKAVSSVPQFASGLVGSMLSNLGSGAAEQIIGKIHAPVNAAVGGAKGAIGGFVKGGPAGAKVGAAKGAMSAMSR